MAAKTTIITGATSGIGKETALGLAKKDHAVYLLVRDTGKGEQLRKELIAETGNNSIYVIECDLADLESVSRAADELRARLDNINVLINNAGGIFAKRELSKDGFEMTFATNHLGHFALTLGLMPLLEKGQARIINVSSEAYKTGKPNFDDLQWERHYSAFKAYGTAKLFNIYFTVSLSEKYSAKGVTAFALHPGLVKTGFGNGLSGFGKLLMWLAGPFMISPEKGAETSIYLATEPKLETKTGHYFIKRKLAGTIEIAQNFTARNRLWNISEELVGIKTEINV
jgi:NAD(P)-dependent dehydrogenase (short-subunit alcohol dehydrogenase family)